MGFGKTFCALGFEDISLLELTGCWSFAQFPRKKQNESSVPKSITAGASSSLPLQLDGHAVHEFPAVARCLIGDIVDGLGSVEGSFQGQGILALDFRAETS